MKRLRAPKGRWDLVSWDLEYEYLVVDRHVGPRKIFKKKTNGEEIDESEDLMLQCVIG